MTPWQTFRWYWTRWVTHRLDGTRRAAREFEAAVKRGRLTWLPSDPQCCGHCIGCTCPKGDVRAEPKETDQ